MSLKSRQIYWACSSLCVYARTLHLFVRSLSAAAGLLMNEYHCGHLTPLEHSSCSWMHFTTAIASGWFKNIPALWKVSKVERRYTKKRVANQFQVRGFDLLQSVDCIVEPVHLLCSSLSHWRTCAVGEAAELTQASIPNWNSDLGYRILMFITHTQKNKIYNFYSRLLLLQKKISYLNVVHCVCVSV